MKSRTIPTGRGIIFISNDPSAEPFDPKSINPADAATYPSGWTTPGLTSKDNKLSLEKEGGETESYHAWELDAVDSEMASAAESFTIKTLEQNKSVWELLHAGGDWDDELKAYQYTDTHTVVRSVQVVFVAGNKRGGVYWNQVAMSEGDPMELGDGLVEQSLRGSILAPLEGKHRVVRFQVREYEKA
ncbi:hypothetical protein ACN082_09765 [Rothia sp. CCM 9417]|uniref:phage tail tube protein n=1 Tax=Rothia sp. CCM 9417 TaxID=3402657 RepID=UPI003AE7B459